MVLGTGIKLYQYVKAYDFAEWIQFEFGIAKNKVYHKLLDDDYIEGSLGSRFSFTDEPTNEIEEWYHEFMIWNLILMKFN
jgi:hypothetical protein